MADSTINELVNLTSVANNDELVLWDTSASETKKATVSNVVTPVATTTATSIATTTVGTTSGIMATGTCSTAAGTAQKAVTSSKWTNNPGESIMVEFSYENTADNVTLKIGSYSAIPVYYLNCASEQISGNAIPAGAVIFTLNAAGTKFYAHLTKTLSEFNINSKLPLNSIGFNTNGLTNMIVKHGAGTDINDCFIKEINKAGFSVWQILQPSGSTIPNSPGTGNAFVLSFQLFYENRLRLTQILINNSGSHTTPSTIYIRQSYSDYGITEITWGNWLQLGV